MRALNVWLGWALAVAALAIGWLQYGWQGVLLALSVVVFWLLLQFSRALRVMRIAAGRPVGHVDSALMLHAQLHAGMTLAQTIKLTRSLGQPRAAAPDSWVWRDAGGDTVQVDLQQGRVVRFSLQRAGPAQTPAA